jgi:hypothetical protein
MEPAPTFGRRHGLLALAVLSLTLIIMASWFRPSRVLRAARVELSLWDGDLTLTVDRDRPLTLGPKPLWEVPTPEQIARIQEELAKQPPVRRMTIGTPPPPLTSEEIEYSNQHTAWWGRAQAEIPHRYVAVLGFSYQRYQNLERDATGRSFSNKVLHQVRGSVYVPWGALALWFGYEIARQRRRRSRHSAGKCLACGYDLRGIVSDKCPECGEATRATAAAPPAGDRVGT